MRLLGVLFIILGSSWAGFLIANQFILRSKELQNLQTALRLLETEVSYGVTPLAEAFDKLANSLSNPIALLFAKAKEYLDQGLIAEEAWRKAVEELKSKMALKERDIQVLLDLAYNLGQTSIEEQLKYLELAQHKLEHLYQSSTKEEAKQVKLWRYLGVLTGLMIAILIV